MVEVGGDEPLAPGDLAGEYAIEARLGAGGFGTVYRAVHEVIGKPAAVKVLHRKLCGDPQAVARFVEEARAVNRIGHGNIVDIFAFGQLADGRHFHVMELLEGRTLEAFLAGRGGLDAAQTLAILRPLARALAAAHAHGIAHRDLKPENVLLIDRDGGGWVPKLIDFGLAKAFLDEAPAEARTRTGAFMGTPEYMSPEQCRGRAIDHRTDVYSFGVLAYRLITGRVPFAGDDSLEVMMKHATAPPEAPSRLRRDLPAAVDRAILAMLEKRPERRPADLASAMAALEAALEAAPDRRRARFALMALGGAALLVGAVWIGWRATSSGDGADGAGPPAAGAAPALQPPAPLRPAGGPDRPRTLAPPPAPDGGMEAKRSDGGRRAPGPEDVEDPYR